MSLHGAAALAVGDLAGVLGMGLLGAVAGGVVGAAYRGLTVERAPRVYPLLVGVGVVGVWLNTASALVAIIGADPAVFADATANLLALVAGGAGALGGARVGDRLAPDLLALSGRRDLDREVSRVVRTVGRFTAVRLPERIDDIEGYQPVSDEKKAELAGRELLFPRGLTVAELRGRLTDRLRDDYGVGHVDAELTEEGELAHLGLGRRAAGVGVTLPPRTAAVAVEADPGPEASPDDRVQVWRRGDAGAERVATADLRAVDGDDATLVLDRRRARELDPAASYRLVTLPTGDRPEREFAALLRASEQTMEAIRVAAGSDLAGLTVGALRPAVIAVRNDGGVETLPGPGRALAAGETVYVVGRRDELRRARAAAGR